MADETNATATATETQPETNGKPAGAGAVLKEVQAGGKGKPAKKKPAAATDEKPEDKGPKVTVNPFAVKWTRKDVVRKEIVKDRRLQHRKELQDLKDGGAVAQYAEVIREAKTAGREMPFAEDGKRIRLVEDAAAKCYWLVDGFQRVGAFEVCNMKEVPADVVKGTFADALMLSLASNSENSVIPRTKDDARRSVFAMLDNPQLLEWALSQSKGKGGVHRTFADLCGCSLGTVNNAFEVRGVKPKDGKLVKAKPKPEKPAKPEARPDAALTVTGGQEPPEVTEAQQRKVDRQRYDEMTAKPTEILVGEAIKSAKRIGAIFAALATDDDKATDVRRVMSEAGFKLASGFDKEAAKNGKDFMPFYSVLEHWDVCKNLVEAFQKIGEIYKAADEANAAAEASESTGK